MKAGYKTTEFWVTVVFNAGVAVSQLSSLNFIPSQYAALAASIATGLYAVSRGIAKVAPQVKAIEAAPAPVVAPVVVPPAPPAA